MYSPHDNNKKTELSPTTQLRQYCANCFYFRPGAVSELNEKNSYLKILGNAKHYCEKGQGSVKKLQACCFFEPWNKRAFKKYDELSDLIGSQEHDSIYKSKLMEQKTELAGYLKSINPDLFSRLCAQKK